MKKQVTSSWSLFIQLTRE